MMPFALVDYYEPWWVQIIKALVIFAVAFAILPLLTVYERKLLGRFQGRYGPNRVGPFGLMQPLAEIVKFATKEPSRPTTSVGYLFRIAPIIAILTAVAALALVPFGDVQNIFGDRVGLYGIDVSIGPLYVFALAGISFYGIMLGGWSSGSKYSFLGAMRGAAQLISYEVSQALSLVGVVITAGTLSLTGIVHAQAECGTSSRSSSASWSSWWPRSRRPIGPRLTSSKPTRSWSAAISPSTAAPPSWPTCSPNT
jgi:NADH-quinone oxidoreductase subunit H